MIPQGTGANLGRRSAWHLSLARFLSTSGQLQSQTRKRAQAELVKDINLSVSSRAKLARRLNGPSIPVSRNGYIPLRASHRSKVDVKGRWSPPRTNSNVIKPEATPIPSAAALSKPRVRSKKLKGKDSAPAETESIDLAITAAKPSSPREETGSSSSSVKEIDGGVSGSGLPIKDSEVEGASVLEAGPSNDHAKSVELEEETIDEVFKDLPPHLNIGEDVESTTKSEQLSQGTIVATDVKISEVKPHREMRIARLRSQLPRVLFSPGIHPMHDPRTGVWNFEEQALHLIPQPEDFAFDRVPPYTSPSGDKELSSLAEEHDCLFTGSTSTLTKALSQIYFALSGGKGVDLQPLSQAFAFERTDFTSGASLAAFLVIGKQSNGRYYIDSDKQWDVENVLSDFGVILEKMLTTEKEEFVRFLKSSPLDTVTEGEMKQKEAYRYQKARSSFLLAAFTRLTLEIRRILSSCDRSWIAMIPGCRVMACLTLKREHVFRFDMTARIMFSYDISKERGYKQSYEKEYYDLVRAAMLKFSFQVRIGAMDGIFVAYHNTARIYGFQYLPLAELDERLFGSTEMAEQAFRLCVSSMEILLAEIVKSFPDQELEVTMKRIGSWKSHHIGAFVRPRQWDAAAGPQPIQLISLTFENMLDGEKVAGPVAFSVDESTRRTQKWSVKYTLWKSYMDTASQEASLSRLKLARKDQASMMYIALPEGKTIDEMDGLDRQAIRNPTDKDTRGGQRERGGVRAEKTDLDERSEVLAAGMNLSTKGGQKSAPQLPYGGYKREPERRSGETRCPDPDNLGMIALRDKGIAGNLDYTRYTMLTLREASSSMQRNLGVFFAIAACTSFTFQDLLVQYIQVIDPIDTISLMFLRVIGPLVIAYTYLYCISQPHLFLGPPEYRRIIVLRSVLQFFGQFAFFQALRHITSGDFPFPGTQARPFLIGFFSAIYLNEPMNGVQKIASGLSIFGEILIAKPTMLLCPPQPSDVIPSGPGSIAHSTATQHYVAFGMMVFFLLFTVFDFIMIRSVSGEVHPFLLIGFSALTTLILCAITLVIQQAPLVLPTTSIAWVILVSCQVASTATTMLFFEALKRETAIVISLVAQFQIVPGTILEYFTFGTHFDIFSAMGALLTTVAGVWAIIKRPKPVEEKSILPTAQDENHALLEEPLLQAEDHEDLHKEPDLV
ncbi:MAG: hypothetical protein TREMPRED_001750 [Tremellales sp. Tagirdzhanova-0007]|nr:MAG: hypothetical protein TREMPRED_001750 [Tremellales sp. Tagirdzhanova-0007]